jgi:hypothetical protein
MIWQAGLKAALPAGSRRSIDFSLCLAIALAGELPDTD